MPPRKKRVPPKKHQPPIEEISEIFYTALKESQRLYDRGALSMDQFVDFRTQLNELYGLHFYEMERGNIDVPQRLFEDVMRLKKNIFSGEQDLSRQVETKKTPKEVAKTNRKRGPQKKRKWKTRPGITTRQGYITALKKRRRDLRNSRILRRFRAGFSLGELAEEFGVGPTAIRTVLVGECKKRKLNYKKLMKENQAKVKAAGKRGRRGRGVAAREEIERFKAANAKRTDRARKVPVEEIKYVVPTPKGISVAKGNIRRINGEISALERGLSPMASTVERIEVRDRVMKLEEDRRLLDRYTKGSLEANHSVAKFLSKLK